jgi:hypothetical protein
MAKLTDIQITQLEPGIPRPLFCAGVYKDTKNNQYMLSSATATTMHILSTLKTEKERFEFLYFAILHEIARIPCFASLTVNNLDKYQKLNEKYNVYWNGNAKNLVPGNIDYLSKAESLFSNKKKDLKWLEKELKKLVDYKFVLF